MTNRLFIVGDVHGMADELDRLVTELKPVDGDRFAFLGDLVDKGPESIAVLARVRELFKRFPGSLSICGNHEESALRLKAKALKAGTWAGIKKVEKEPWLALAPDSDFEFMDSLPLYARPFGSRSVLLVHGGLFPAYFDNYSGLPMLTRWWRAEKGKQMDRARRFLRVRHVHRETGAMVQLGDESELTRPWAEWYDGREGYAFFGHEPQRKGIPSVHQHAMGLDTGAVFGGYLTAGVIYGDSNRVTEVVPVQAHKAFAEWLDTGEE